MGQGWEMIDVGVEVGVRVGGRKGQLQKEEREVGVEGERYGESDSDAPEGGTRAEREGEGFSTFRASHPQMINSLGLGEVKSDK